MTEVSLVTVYKEIVEVKRKLDTIEDLIIPTEEVSKEKLEDIEQLKKESLEGEHVRWDELKEELSL